MHSWHTEEEARQLSELMVSIARLVGRKAVALLSDMNQPLGNAVGNALEVKEAIDTLHRQGPQDFRHHCLVVGGHLLALGDMAADEEAGLVMAQRALDGGAAWEKFRELVIAQGGDVRYVDEPERLPVAPLIETIPAPRSGHLAGVNACEVGETAVELGAGRARKGDPIDHAVGIEIHHKVGDRVEAGEPLFTIHAHSSESLEEARRRLLEAHTWSDSPSRAVAVVLWGDSRIKSNP